MLDLKRFNAIHWNIQQASGSSGEPIPEIVIEEIIRKNVDIGCITEYYSQATNAREFEKRLQDLGYNVYTTNSAQNQNDVLIFVRDSFRSKQVMEFIWNERNTYPNYLEVLVNGEGFSLTVVGCRVRVFTNTTTEKDRQFRISQMNELNARLKKIITPCLVMGDFNGREKWMHKNIVADGFEVCKSNGDTYSFDNGFSVVIDHVVVKGLKAKIKASWDFTDLAPHIYKQGPFTSCIPRPYPDHAQLLCDLCIIVDKKLTDKMFESHTAPDWRMISNMGKPENELTKVVMAEMPQGSDMHVKIKNMIEVDLGITSGRGCTYPFLIKCVANAIKPFYDEKKSA